MEREFENKKSDEKTAALQMWREGQTVVKISEALGVTRATVYRWVKVADQKLSEPDRRSRLQVDLATKSRILELYVLLKKPSMTRLSKALSHYFHIQLSSYQLRRYLKRWGWDCFEPSALFDSVSRSVSDQDIVGDEGFGSENSHKSAEDFSI